MTGEQNGGKGVDVGYPIPNPVVKIFKLFVLYLHHILPSNYNFTNYANFVPENQDYFILLTYLLT